ncbi:hypothetical protein [Nocardioides lijunqiniae]|uniref:hypothetical protein n=1 Tax=Nocardioides lijunqiniae TaxID=2760832 RepID=UPI0018775AE0|nr:hypothetical protein [Nocardioides lijunqiniae]
MAEPGDHETLTQLVFAHDDPQNAPKPKDFDGVSVLRGHLGTLEAAGFVRRARWAYPGDRVRYSNVGKLREAGFTVTFSPSRNIPIHVSVSCEAEWDQNLSDQFDACFGEVSDTYEGGEEE